MEYRRLGNSDLMVSVAGMGCWTMGGVLGEGESAVGWSGVDDAESIRAVHTALDLGVNLFDTADAYGNGHGEEVLGQALRGRRSQAIVATKAGNVWNGRSFDWDASRAHIMAAVQASLRRLGTDWIDLYQLHGGREEDDLEGVLEAFERLREQGHIRWYGVSSHRPEVLRRMAAGGLTSVQLNYNMLERQIEADLLPFCQERGLGVLVRGPVAKGFLTGKITRETRFGPDDYRHRMTQDPERVGRWLEQVERLRPLATRERTLGQAAIQFVLSHPAVTCTIPGARNAAQVAENAAAAQAPPLAATERALIDRVSPPPAAA